MTAHSDGRTLPWRFLGRQVRPYALAVSMACAVIFVSMVTESGVGTQLDGPWGKAIGAAAGATTVTLWAGWWSQRRTWMTQGLLMAGSTWAAIAAIVLAEGASWPSGTLAVCWVVASVGSWLLEVKDPRGR